MSNVCPVVLGVALLAVHPRFGAAEPADVHAEVRAVDGLGDVDHMRLALVAAGLRWRIAPTFHVRAVALGLATTGTADLGEPARGGFGGELGAQIVPWPTARVRPYAKASLGALLFLRRPFLPGGDFYEGIITFGAGTAITPSARWTLAADVFLVHLSNGQGLGAFNPAYDGYGATIGVGYDLGAAPPTSPVRVPAPPAPHDVIVDASLGATGEARLYSGRVRPSLRLSRHAVGALDIEAGALAGEPFVEAGGDVIGALGWLRAGLHGGYRRYVGTNTAVITAQLEASATPELELVAMGHHERSDVFGTLWRAAVGLRLAPTSTLVVDLGIGFDRLGDHTVFGDDHSDPYFGFEWRSPWGTSNHRLAAFVERQISTLNLVGIRVTGPAPAWRRLR